MRESAWDPSAQSGPFVARCLCCCRGCSQSSFTPRLSPHACPQVLGAGFKPLEMRAVGYDAKALQAAGVTLPKLRAAGVSVGDLRSAGFKSEELRQVGAHARELHGVGASASELREAGYPLSEFCKLYDVGELRGGGFSCEELRLVGFSASEVLSTGASHKDLSVGGYSAGELKAVGVGAKELKALQFKCADLKACGFNAKALAAVGFDSYALKMGGFRPRHVKECGFKGSSVFGTPCAEGSEETQRETLARATHHRPHLTSYVTRARALRSCLRSLSCLSARATRPEGRRIWSDGTLEGRRLHVAAAERVLQCGQLADRWRSQGGGVAGGGLLAHSDAGRRLRV